MSALHLTLLARSFPKEEEKILELWAKLDAFKEQLRRTEGKPEYIFYGELELSCSSDHASPC